jgi:hypothetical protein
MSIGTTTWRAAHETLSCRARERAAADAEEGRGLLAALRAAVHVHLGFGNFGEYVERLFGYKPRSTQEKLRVAEALEGLPELERALEQGALSWSAVRELTRVAVAATEATWLAAAAGKSVRQLEELVGGKRPGDSPDGAPDPALLRHVLRFEVAPETFALFREALRELRRASGQTLDDDSALLTMARHVLVGPSDEGRASYQVSMSLCSQCGAGQQTANGSVVPVGSDVLAMAECDAQRTQPTVAPHAHVGSRARQTIPPTVRRGVLQRDHHRCRVPGCRNAIFLDLHHIQPRADGGRHHPDNLLTLCSAHHRAAHRGELVIAGTSAESAEFRHTDGNLYGQPAAPARDAAAQVASGLRNLGFREHEVRAVLAELQREQRPRPLTASELLREALVRLRPGKTHRA